MEPASKATLGIFEIVDFPELEVSNVIAKVDTGSYSGTLHATRTHLSEEQGEPTLHFAPLGDEANMQKTTDFEVKSVRSSNGIQTGRYFINTKITIAGKTMPITISLYDRSDMKWEVLIGRKFMKENNLAVDPSLDKR